MAELTKPVEPKVYVPTGDVAADKIGQETYDKDKKQYDLDLAAYNKQEEEKVNLANIEAEKKALEAIDADTTLTPEEKELMKRALKPKANAKNNTPDPGAAPKPEILTDEDKAALINYRRLRSNPDTLPYIDALEGGTIEKVILDLLPKGEDISKLTDEQVYERSLVLDGLTETEVKEQMEEFATYKGKKKRDSIAEAKKKVSETTSVALPEKVKLKLQKDSQDKIAYDKLCAKNIKDADVQLNAEISAVVGKEWNGITIAPEEKDLLEKTIIAYTPKRYTNEGLKINVKGGFEAGLRVFAFDKVVKAKEERIQFLENEVDALRTFAAKRFRVSDNGGGGGNGSPTRTPKKEDIKW